MTSLKGREAPAYFVKIAAPAERALRGAGVLTAQDLTKFSKVEILNLHGMGSGSIPKLEAALAANGLSFKNE